MMPTRNAFKVVVLFFSIASIDGCAKEGKMESAGTLAASPMPLCVESELTGVSPDGAEVETHREFQLPTIAYPVGERPDDWGLPLTLQVDATGRVTCYLVKDDFDRTRVIDQRRQALLAAASGWRYRPFRRDGKSVDAIVREQVYEEISPSNPEKLPDVPLSGISISLSRSGCYGTCPSYLIEIHGDGEVVYVGGSYVDVLGRHSYRISPQAVAELVGIARRDDIWGLSGSYRAQVTDNPTYVLKLKAGASSRTIEDYVGKRAGMPEVIREFEEAVDRIGRADEWTRLSTMAVERLQSEGFDFTSKESADLLVRALANDNGNDQQAMLRLIELGAPLSGGNPYGPMTGGVDTSAIDQALLNHREQVVGPLLQRGVLDTEGRPDQEKIDKGFRDAIRGGRLSLVETLWDQHADRPHPALMFRDANDEAKVVKQSPVTLLLSKPYGDKGWQGLEIAKWLKGEGCDLKAHGADGNTLLHAAVDANDLAFAKYLLEQGVDPSTPGRFDLPALGSATGEEMALLLLNAGSEWGMDDNGKGFLRYARDQHWGRVMAWISAHPRSRITPPASSP